MLERINYQSKNAELWGCFNGCCTEFKKHDLTSDPVLKGITDKYTDLTDKFGVSIGVLRKNSSTEKLMTANGTADRSFISLKYAIKSCLYSPDSSEAEKAAKLWDLIKSEGVSMHTESYQSQIAKMNSLNGRLKSAEYTAITNNLAAVKTALIHFDSALSSFMTLYDASISKTAELEQIIPATEYRRELVQLHNQKLTSYFNLFDTENKYKQLVDTLNVHVNRLNEELRARETRKESVKTEQQ